MFSMSSQILNTMDKVDKAVTKANYRNLGHAAASLRKKARESIKTDPNASRPGRPPNTRRRQMPNATVYKVDDNGLDAIIGPRGSRVGQSAEIHEFGGPHLGSDHIRRNFPARPFMGPALDESAPRFAAEWQSSIGAP